MNDNGKQEDITEGFRKQMEQDAQPLRMDMGVYWWIYAMQDGKRIIWGSFPTEEEAMQTGYSVLSGNFECVPLRTKNSVEASRILRARVLAETQNVPLTFKRFEHERGLKRRLEQERKRLGKKREIE